MAFASSQGLRIYYEAVGDGPPLLLHHGTMFSGQSWRLYGYVDALARDYRVILIDARGHGASDKPHDPNLYQMSDLASDVVAVLDDLGIGKVNYWGYSYGASVGFALAKYAPGRIASLLIGGGHPYEADMSLNIGQETPDAEAVIAAVFKIIGGDPDSIPEEPRKILLANDFVALNALYRHHPSQEDGLANIDMPCLIYCGDADPRFEQARQAAGQITGAKFVALPNSNHGQVMRAKDTIMPHALDLLSVASALATC